MRSAAAAAVAHASSSARMCSLFTAAAPDDQRLYSARGGRPSTPSGSSRASARDDQALGVLAAPLEELNQIGAGSVGRARHRAPARADPHQGARDHQQRRRLALPGGGDARAATAPPALQARAERLGATFRSPSSRCRSTRASVAGLRRAQTGECCSSTTPTRCRRTRRSRSTATSTSDVGYRTRSMLVVPMADARRAR